MTWTVEEWIDVPPGTHIEAAAVALVGAANMARAEVAMSFNGVKVLARPGDKPAEVAASYGREVEAMAAARRASPEGKAAARASAAEVAALQTKADELATRVHSLDFTDHGAVLDFLAELQPCSDRTGVTVRKEDITAAFARAGLTPNMSTGWAAAASEETFFRWLVGQALDGLTRGPAIHGIFHKFAAEWRAKWGRP